LWRSHHDLRPLTVFRDSGTQKFANQAEDSFISDTVLHKLYQPFMLKAAVETADIRVQNPAYLTLRDRYIDRIQGIMRASARSKSIAEAKKILFVY
jgi:hypothetical protein